MCLRESNSFPTKPNLEEVDFSVGSSSSKGILAKAVVGNYLYKTGTFTRPKSSCVEPVTECICSEILDLMKIPHAEYELVEARVKPNNLWKSQSVVCCRSKLFTNENVKLVTGNRIVKGPKTYESIINSIDVEFSIQLIT